jgi:hypothetical protein
MPSKGTRRRLTVRVPIDTYLGAARAAAARGWSMTGYASYALGEQLKRDASATTRLEQTNSG